ncbi:cobalamin biosynthesis protein [Lampropedia puyangensis]|nr:cobalamin biosynthesis protein [Lampropedia puyangensis]
MTTGIDTNISTTQHHGTIAIGLGLREGACTADLAALWQQAQPLWCRNTPRTPLLIAVLERKREHPALLTFLREHLPFARCMAISDATLQGILTPTQSATSLQRFGCGSVCEALAWAAISSLQGIPPRGQWLLLRQISSNRLATLAMVQSPDLRISS